MVAGGACYKGCVIVPKLPGRGYQVVVRDLMLFGSAGLARIWTARILYQPDPAGDS